MNVGQVIKITLYELSLQTPIKKKWFGGDYHALKITVHPGFIRAAEDLIMAGLKHLGMGSSFSISVEGDIYFYLLSTQPISLPTNFFQETLPLAINAFIDGFSQHWTKIQSSDDVIYEHMFDETCPHFDDILKHAVSNKNVKILDRSWGSKIAISGTEENIDGFIQSIVSKLSPLYAEPISPVPSLQTICNTAVIKNYSFFSAAMKALPEPLQWLTLQSVDDVTPFAGKIVLYKADRGFSNYGAHSIHPDRKDIMVGLISDKCTKYAYDEIGYDFKTLLTTPGHMSNGLSTSNLKYSNFYVKLPDLDELNAIDAALISRKANIGGRFDYYQLIRAQIDEIGLSAPDLSI